MVYTMSKTSPKNAKSKYIICHQSRNQRSQEMLRTEVHDKRNYSLLPPQKRKENTPSPYQGEGWGYS